MRRSLLVLWIFVMLAGGCAGGSAAAAGPRPSSPFSDADSKLFEDGVDFVADPAVLGGRWAEDSESEAFARIDAADVIALITVNTLRTDIDPQQRTNYGLGLNVAEKLKGAFVVDATLTVSGDAQGFASIDRDRQRLLSERFVVFVKWYAKPDGIVAGHFHLTIASPVVLEQVRSRLHGSRPSNNIIIERHVSAP